ncbi:MAG TPA: hypothetical protein VGL92_10965 [Acidimicrobiia bacterium]|jgi:outer membrane lipoprotein-sorting protein
MQRRTFRNAALIILAALSLSACARAAEEEASQAEPAKVEKIKGTDTERLILQPEAAERIGIETSTVREVSRADGPRKVVDYAAVIYDPDGQASVYVNTKPLVFVRYPVTVEYINGDLAVLSDGPPLDADVVTQGVAELFGIEFGIGEFE